MVSVLSHWMSLLSIKWKHYILTFRQQVFWDLSLYQRKTEYHGAHCVFSRVCIGTAVTPQSIIIINITCRPYLFELWCVFFS